MSNGMPMDMLGNMNPLSMIGRDKAERIAQFVTAQQAELADAIRDLETACGIPEHDRIDVPSESEATDELLDTIEAKFAGNLHMRVLTDEYPEACEHGSNSELVGLSPSRWTKTKVAWADKMRQVGHEGTDSELVDQFLRENRSLSLEAVERDWIGGLTSEREREYLADRIAGPLRNAPDRIRECAEIVTGDGTPVVE